MKPIREIAANLGISEGHLVPYGLYKSKISLDAMKPQSEQSGKLIVVTGITLRWYRFFRQLAKRESRS